MLTFHPFPVASWQQRLSRACPPPPALRCFYCCLPRSNMSVLIVLKCNQGICSGGVKSLNLREDLRQPWAWTSPLTKSSRCIYGGGETFSRGLSYCWAPQVESKDTQAEFAGNDLSLDLTSSPQTGQHPRLLRGLKLAVIHGAANPSFLGSCRNSGYAGKEKTKTRTLNHTFSELNQVISCNTQT